jgi:Protein of unknown function (DUF3455)
MRLSLFLILFVAIPCGAQTPAAIPDNLKPPGGATLLLHLHATGDQIYACDGAAWVFERPDARLFDDSGRQMGTHFAGPTWEYADHSRVIGKLVANATPDPDSIPWLLLEAKDHQGDGMMQTVTAIQRVHTQAGKAPPTGCDAGHKGAEVRSHYSADYLFYSAR